MTNELQNIKEKIRKLVNKTISNGCTENEAMISAAKVGELLSHYNLSMDEVMLGQQECKTGSFKIPNRSYACGDYVRLKILCIFNRVYETRSLTPCG